MPDHVLAMYSADAVASDNVGGVEPGTECALLIVLRHFPGDDLDFDRALVAAHDSGWLEVKVEEAAFVSPDRELHPGFEEQLQETYQGALHNGFHVLYFRG